MAQTLEQFMEATGAELVAGNLVVGNMAGRKIVGTYDGTFNLNEEGLAMAAELEGEAPKRTRKKAADAAEDAAPEAA